MRFPRQTYERFRDLLRPPPPDPAQELFRLKYVERDVILAIKALCFAFLIYYFYFTSWSAEIQTAKQIAESMTQKAFGFYLALNIALAIYLIKSRRLSLVWGRRVIFVMSVLDSLFLAALTLISYPGGFDSALYWVFLGLIIRNAVSFPIARVQIVLNVTLILGFICAGVAHARIVRNDLLELTPSTQSAMKSITEPEPEAEPVVLRITVLVFMMASCYGLQVLFGKARLAEEESRESVARQEQLRAAGRLAAEIAHQMKNPLGIINNAAFALQRSVAAGKPIPLPQLDIIREEVARSDRIITELMRRVRSSD